MQATINGFRMNFTVEGPDAAPTVVLHHPLATDLTIWDELTAALLPRYRVVRFDARGQGASEVTPAPYALPTLAADTVALMDHLGVARAHFLGLSMGGMVGQHLGVDHGRRFLSLTLCSTTSRTPAAAQVIHAAIAGSEYIEVPGVSHQLHVEQPATFNAHVLAFLNKQAAA